VVELKVSACPIGGTFFDELCLLMLRDTMLFRGELKVSGTNGTDIVLSSYQSSP